MNQAKEITVTFTIGEGRNAAAALALALRSEEFSGFQKPTLQRAKDKIDTALRGELRGGDAQPGGRAP